MGINALRLGYLEFGSQNPTDFRATAENCITCGACAANCENQALVLEENEGERRLMLCGTLLNSQSIKHCKGCGAKLGSEQYLQFISKKTQNLSPAVEAQLLCQDCQRKNGAGLNKGPMPLA
jgi:ferredoxin